MFCLIVTSIAEGGHASTQGVRVGDLILEVNDNPVRNNVEFARELSKASSEIVLKIYRDGDDLFFKMPSGKLGIIAEEKIIDLEEARRAHLNERLSSEIPVATMDSVEGRRTLRIVGIVSAEYAVGMNLIKDIFVSGRDIFGGRSKIVQDAFHEARETCLLEVRKETHKIGGNAILGLRFQHSQMSGAGTTMLLLVATGTAVVLE